MGVNKFSLLRGETFKTLELLESIHGHSGGHFTNDRTEELPTLFLVVQSVRNNPYLLTGKFSWFTLENIGQPLGQNCEPHIRVEIELRKTEIQLSKIDTHKK